MLYIIRGVFFLRTPKEKNMERKQLDTVIEKEVYKLVSNIKEHTKSFVHLTARRKGLKVDPELLELLTQVVDLGIEDGFQTQVELFNRGIGKALDKYTAEENPTQLTSSKRRTATVG